MAAQNSEAGASSPHLDANEQDQAASHAAPAALVIHEIIREEGEAAVVRPAGALAWSGFAAGLSMGFSFLTQAMLRAGIGDEQPWHRLVDSAGYSVGFLIVILGRQQLFTESTLTAVLPLLTNWTGERLLLTLRLWAIVIAANIIGTVVFATLITPEALFRPAVAVALETLSREALAGSFWSILLKSIFAGWLIALMVWLLPSARSARILIILILTYVVALGGFSHIIAGSAEAAYAVFIGQAGLADALAKFFLPTLIGNTIGGVSLVALLNHAAIAPEIEAHSVR